jgi:hypothetical protein
MVEEVGEILLTWGRDEAPDEESSARILGESLPTIQVVRVLRARYRRRFRIDPTEGSMPPPGPIRAGGPPGTKPLLPDDELTRKRERWIRDIISKPLPAAPVLLPITRFDADADGYAETCGLDADFDGRPDRFEADLDSDRVMETSFLPQRGGWVAEDTPTGRAARDAAMRNSPGSRPGEEPSGPAGKAGGPATLPGAPPEPPGPSVPPPPGEEARRQG